MKNEHKRPSGCMTLRIAAVLFCLVLFSMHLTAGLFARYTAKQGGTDSARVAAFKVNVEGIGNSVNVDYVKGNGQVFPFSIQLILEIEILSPHNSFNVIPL